MKIFSVVSLVASLFLIQVSYSFSWHWFTDLFSRNGNQEYHEVKVFRFTAKSSLMLEIEDIYGGNIEVVEDDKADTISIEGTLYAVEDHEVDVKPHMVESSNKLKIHTKKSTLMAAKAYISYKIIIPAGTERLIIKTKSGRVYVKNIHASLWVSTQSGSVALEYSQMPEAVINTQSGEVIITHSSGTLLEVDTLSGNVVMKDVLYEKYMVDTHSGLVQMGMVSGSVVLKTNSGLIHVYNATIEGIVESQSGSITVDALPKNHTLAIESISGTIILEVDKKSEIPVCAKTSSGTLKTVIPLWPHTPKAVKNIIIKTLTGSIIIKHKDVVRATTKEG